MTWVAYAMELLHATIAYSLLIMKWWLMVVSWFLSYQLLYI